jgi:hypothetical protein
MSPDYNHIIIVIIIIMYPFSFLLLQATGCLQTFKWRYRI